MTGASLASEFRASYSFYSSFKCQIISRSTGTSVVSSPVKFFHKNVANFTTFGLQQYLQIALYALHLIASGNYHISACGKEANNIDMERRILLGFMD